MIDKASNLAKYQWIIILTSILFLAGCAKPYIPPVIEPLNSSDQQFDGLLTLLSKHGSLHVVWIHGMCPHTKEDWAGRRVSELAERLGIELDNLPQSLAIGDFVYRYLISYKNKSIVLDMVVWSEIIEQRRRSLCFDSRHADDGVVYEACGENARYPHRRAVINNALKSGLINSCLADALIYTGAQGSEVRARLRPEIEAALSSPPDGNQTPLLFVSESLGSKIIFDTVQEIMDQSSSYSSESTFAMMLANTSQIIMFANQIPILDLTEPEPDPSDMESASVNNNSSSLRGFVSGINRLKRLKMEMTGEKIERLKVIAFSDPNDVLSYRLPKGYFPDKMKTDTINIMPSNDYVWFGLLEHPLNAHKNYIYTDDVINRFLCGNPISTKCLSDLPNK
ncbi:MAG: hypothetical protein ABW092_07515 [Candidatus Thiodiazotropha sp.]